MEKPIPQEIQRKIPRRVREIWKKFQKNGWEIYLVGGAVRDLWQNEKIKDLDFATNAPPEEIQKLFPKSFYDNQYGTVRIPTPQGLVEITTYRHEDNYADFRHPQKIRWGQKLAGDLKRRDFTINAMALGPQKNNPQKLVFIDNFNGEKDLKNKILRAVGDPQKRFQEDALRILRAIRFAAQLDLKIENKTKEALIKNAPLLKKISGERIRDELFRILLLKNVAQAFRLMRETQIIPQILPELARSYDMKQKGHHLWDAWEHSLRATQHCPSSDPIVKLATLLHDVGKPFTVKDINGERTFYNHEVVGAKIAAAIGQRLRLSKKDQERLVKLVRWHQFSVSENQTDKAIRRFIRRVGKENIAAMLDLRTGDRLGSGAKLTSWRLEKFKKRLIEVQKQPFAVTDLKINGHDVMKILSLSPGPQVGKILEAIFEKVVKGEVPNEREKLLKEIKKFKP